MRVALVHDWLVGVRGGEKVLEEIVLAMKEREDVEEIVLFTLVHRKGSQRETIENLPIRTSFIQRLPWGKSRYRSYLPLFPAAAESFDLSGFDIVVSSSHAVAKGVVPPPEALHICYCHTPMRYVWNQFGAYFGKSRGIKRLIVSGAAHYLRTWDAASSARVDLFVANSRNVGRRIELYYRRESQLLYPPVDTEFFTPGEEGDQREPFFLLVSALVPYKRVDLAVEAFNRSGIPLRILGEGPEGKRLRKMARSNITFLGGNDDTVIREHYRKAKALIFPGEEDFGIVPLEAQSCGTPVIAFGRGGALETVVENETGLFFHEGTPESLGEAVDNFGKGVFNRDRMRENALRFSRERFRRQWREIVSRLQESRKP